MDCESLFFYFYIIREVQVDRMLDRYLQQNMEFANSNEDVWNMCKLFVNCYEVSADFIQIDINTNHIQYFLDVW